jgi:hypothetical protein
MYVIICWNLHEYSCFLLDFRRVKLLIFFLKAEKDDDHLSNIFTVGIVTCRAGVHVWSLTNEQYNDFQDRDYVIICWNLHEYSCFLLDFCRVKLLIFNSGKSIVNDTGKQA